MIPTGKITTLAAALWLFALPPQSAIAEGAGAEGARAEEFKAGAITISQAWSRATPGGARVGGGYMTITNNGNTADKLVSASSDIAARVSIHTMTMVKSVMRMRPLKGGLVILPGKPVALAPGGHHLMLIGLKKPFRKGQSFNVAFKFERAGEVAVAFKIEAIGAARPGNSKQTNMKPPIMIQNDKMPGGMEPKGMMQPGDGKMPMKMDHGARGSHDR